MHSGFVIGLLQSCVGSSYGTAGPLNPFCETQIIPAPYSYDKKKMGEKKPPAVTLGLLPEQYEAPLEFTPLAAFVQAKIHAAQFPNKFYLFCMHPGHMGRKQNTILVRASPPPQDHPSLVLGLRELRRKVKQYLVKLYPGVQDMSAPCSIGQITHCFK